MPASLIVLGESDIIIQQAQRADGLQTESRVFVFAETPLGAYSTTVSLIF